MKMWKLTFVFTLCFTALLAQDCTWSVNNDVPDGNGFYQPLYIRNNNDFSIRGFWLPQSGDVVTVPNGDTVLFSCTGRAFIPGGPLFQDANLTCVGDKTWFEASSGETYLFRFLNCTDGEPFHIARYAAINTCSGAPDIQEVEIGFKLLSTGEFYRLIKICFNTVTYDSVYARIKQVPEIIGHQSGFPRTEFLQGGFYPDMNDVDELYTQVSQTAAVAQAVGSTTLAEQYIQASKYLSSAYDTDYYLSRGHLAAKEDFLYGSHQRASFWLMNVAPQWQTFNGGNWNKLEIDMRTYVQNQANDLFVYIGTSGILKLEDVNGVEQEIYLDYPAEYIKGAGIYWRVIYDPVRQLATGFIGLNNPYEDEADVSAFFNLCPNICDQLTNWDITWDGNNTVSGYQYCSDIASMRRVIPEIPTDFVVTGILN